MEIINEKLNYYLSMNSQLKYGKYCNTRKIFNHTVQNSAAQRSAAQRSAAQRSAAQRSAAQRSAAQRSAAQRSTVAANEMQNNHLGAYKQPCVLYNWKAVHLCTTS